MNSPTDRSGAPWAELDALLDHALSLPDEARAEWLQTLAHTASDRAERLSRLLQLLQKTAAFDSVAATESLATALVSVAQLTEGTRIANWCIERSIGSGGMAEVYLASRPLEQGAQYAALKVLSLGMGSAQAMARFNREAAILSQLNDPGIARLIDAGRTDDGRQWLAMEYVEGEPIDLGCDRLGLSVRARVALMAKIARVVDYAHRQLVIHRDIKPGNVLLCGDGKEIRLLDFGIAKIIETPGASMTRADTLVFTPAYASPEQLAGAPVSTASDIYQLGILMYLLLTGTRPFKHVESTPAGLLNAMDEAAVAPSRCIQDRSGNAAAGRVDTARRQRLLRGDLDTIVLKAIERMPQRRYLSAHEFADDLERWLDGEPIMARPALLYRWGKKLRKHWMTALAAVISVILIIAYGFNLERSRRDIAAERDSAQRALVRAEATRRFMSRVLATTNPADSAEGGRDINEVLADAADSVATEFADQPEVAAEIYTELGDAFDGRGDSSSAAEVYRKALELDAQLGHPVNAGALGGLAVALSDLGRGEEAREILARDLPAARAHYGAESITFVELLVSQARVEQSFVPFQETPSFRDNRERKVRGLLEQARDIYDRLASSGDPQVNDFDVQGMREDIDGSIGLSYFRSGQMELALPLLRQHHETQIRRHGRNAARTLSARMNLTAVLRKLGQFDESEELLLNMVDKLRQQYGRGRHRMVAYALGTLGNQALATGNLKQAIAYWTEAEQEGVDALGADDPWIAKAQLKRAEILAEDGQKDAALAILLPLSQLRDRTDGLQDAAAKLRDSLASGQAR